MTAEASHVCVCVCTFKRPEFLRRLLEKLADQKTDGLFTYSVVVVDNDHSRSAESEVAKFAATSGIPIRYCVEPEQNIAMARNKAVENATGDYVAFIDDDEFPAENWLVTLFKTCREYGVAGVLGPVYSHFDEEPPKWIVRGKFWQRPTHPTGMRIEGSMGRTGNVLLRKAIFEADKRPFRPEFRAGEDQEFFTRMIEAGHDFIWCNEAAAYEVIPPSRWARSFILRRSFFQGSHTPYEQRFGVTGFLKSVIAIPVYVAVLPFAAITGQHRLMSVLARLAHHSGKIFTCLGIKVIKGPYVTE